MNVQGVVVNVTELDRSIAFYCDVLEFTLLSRKEQLAVVHAPGDGRTQVIVLRAFGSSPLGGARHIGLRAVVLEVDEVGQLERIAGELDAHSMLLDRRVHTEWTALVGRDPDGVTVVVTWHPGGAGTSESSWRTLDDLLYGIGE